MEDKPIKWQSVVDKCDHRTGIVHLWRLVKGLSSEKSYNLPNKGVRFADKTYLFPKKIANKFAHQLNINTNTSGRLYVQKTVQMAIPSATINRNAVFLACRHKRSDPIGQIVHSHWTRRDEHRPPHETRSRCHQLSH